MPIVESGEPINQIHQSRNLLLTIITQNLLRSRIGRIGRRRVIHGHLAIEEPLKIRRQGATLNSILVRMIGAIELEIVTGDTVVRVMHH